MVEELSAVVYVESGVRGSCTAGDTAVIETWDIAKTYRAPFRGLSVSWWSPAAVEALRGITIQIARGEIFGLLGPNGAGKTTMLRLLATLIVPTRGGGRIDGADLVGQAASVRRAVAYASGDERGFYGRLSGHENLEFFAGLLGLPPRDAGRRVDDVLEQLDLGPMARRPVAQYSRGMRQRLCIARALLGTPRVLLLDEPTRSLDPVMATGFRRLVCRLSTDTAMTIVLASHDLAEAEQLCHRVAVLRHGSLCAVLQMGARNQGLTAWYESVLAAT